MQVLVTEMEDCSTHLSRCLILIFRPFTTRGPLNSILPDRASLLIELPRHQQLLGIETVSPRFPKLDAHTLVIWSRWSQTKDALILLSVWKGTEWNVKSDKHALPKRILLGSDSKLTLQCPVRHNESKRTCYAAEERRFEYLSQQLNKT